MLPLAAHSFLIWPGTRQKFDNAFFIFEQTEHWSRTIAMALANAGAAESAPLVKTDAELWARMLAVNLTGTFLTSREGLRRMKGSGSEEARLALAATNPMGRVLGHGPQARGVGQRDPVGSLG